MSSIASTTRKHDQQPVNRLLNPIAIRPEHIAAEATTLRLYPKNDIQSATDCDYIIEDAVTGSKMFSATGKRYGASPGREFRDSTGLPLFELRRVAAFSRWPVRVRLPGDNEKDLISICTRGPQRKVKLDIVQNRGNSTAAAVADGDRKSEKEKEKEQETVVRMEVRRTTLLFTFDVLVSDQKVADIRVNLELNKSLGFSIPNPYGNMPPKCILDIRLAEGLDMSIAALVAVFVSDMFI